MLVNGPYLYFVYNHVYPRFSNCALGTFKKMCLSQSLVSFTSILLFYTFVPIFKGGSLIESKKEFEEKAWTTMVRNWQLWPLVQLINFTLIPACYQVPYVNLFALMFNVYLSYMAFVFKPAALQTPSLLQTAQLHSSAS